MVKIKMNEHIHLQIVHQKMQRPEKSLMPADPRIVNHQIKYPSTEIEEKSGVMATAEPAKCVKNK